MKLTNCIICNKKLISKQQKICADHKCFDKYHDNLKLEKKILLLEKENIMQMYENFELKKELIVLHESLGFEDWYDKYKHKILRRIRTEFAKHVKPSTLHK